MTARLVSLDPDLVEVGERHRVELGAMSELTDSIRRVGLLNAITVDIEHKLIAGERRLRAWKVANPGQPIPAHVVDNLDDAHAVLIAERDENTCRKDFTPSEAVALGRALEALEAPRAAERQGTRTDLEPSAKLARGSTRDVVSDAVGMSGESYRKAKKVVAVAEDATQPEPVRVAAREAVAEMDATGKVDAPFKKVRAAEGRASAEERYPFLKDVPAPNDQVIATANALDAVPEAEKERRLDSARKWAEMMRRNADRTLGEDDERATDAHHAVARALNGLTAWNVDAQRALDRWDDLVTDPSLGIDEWTGAIALARQHLDAIEQHTKQKLRRVK